MARQEALAILLGEGALQNVKSKVSPCITWQVYVSQCCSPVQYEYQ